MPPALASVILIVIGAGVLAVAYHGYRYGELPAGANFLHAWRPNRKDNGFAFHFFLVLYYCGGFALVIWGLLLMLGMAPTLQWQ